MKVGRGLSRWLAMGVAAPLLFVTTPPSGAEVSRGLPPGLRPFVVNVDETLQRRYGEPQVAVNPKNPNNIVIASTDLGYVEGCQAPVVQPKCELIPRPGLGPSPAGFFDDADGFDSNGVFVTFDGGRRWRKVDVTDLHPAGRPELDGQGDAMVAVGPDGTFYLGWDALNWSLGANFLPNAGIAVSKSTDGGRTWSEPVLTGTPADRPWMHVDQSTGTVYVVSGCPFCPLGPRSTGDPSSPSGTVGDKWLVASQDGVHWTTPQRLGGTDGTNQYSAELFGTIMSVANGVVATALRSTNPAACAFFVGGTAPCTVFQTTTDAGATWSRHRVPLPFLGSGPAMVAADPSRRGHFTVATLNDSSTEFWVYRTRNSGRTWSEPVKVTQDPSKTHWHPRLDYSRRGVLGLMWRTNEEAPYPALSPYTVWAAISDDGGRTFSQPLEVSDGGSPAPASGAFDGTRADDLSYIALDDRKQRVYVVWSDWRSGERNNIFSAVKYQAFRHDRR